MSFSLTCLLVHSLKQERKQGNYTGIVQTPGSSHKGESGIWTPSLGCVRTEVVYEPLTQKLDSLSLSLEFKAFPDSVRVCNPHFNSRSSLFMESTLEKPNFLHTWPNISAHAGFFHVPLTSTCPNTSHHAGSFEIPLPLRIISTPFLKTLAVCLHAGSESFPL